MQFSAIRNSILSAIGIIMLLATSAQSAGLLLYETGAPDLGTASAGRAAMAADASSARTMERGNSTPSSPTR